MSTTTIDIADSDVPKRPSSSTHFAFRHRVFGIKGSYFAYMRQSTVVGFHLPLGDMFGVAPINRIQEEFRLDPDGHDGRLLQTVTRGLRYVREIRPGDSIPSEILDGTASWSVEAKHHEVAGNRLYLQVWSRTKGEERVIAAPHVQEQIAHDPSIRRIINDGLWALAAELGYGEDGVKEVEFQIERVRREIVFIEALRDRSAYVMEIAAGLDRYNKLYGNVRDVEAKIGRARALIRIPLERLNNKFAEVDARTGSILRLLRDVDATISLIRGNRDDLHFDLLAWSGLIESWKNAGYECGEAALALIGETYKFLAAHYSTASAQTRTGRMH